MVIKRKLESAFIQINKGNNCLSHPTMNLNRIVLTLTRYEAYPPPPKHHGL